MLIGILQCGHFLDRTNGALGGYDDLVTKMMSGHGLTFRTWNVIDMEFPESIAEAQGWLITGSKYGVYDDMPFIAPLEDFICRAYAKSVPMVGICFGHQIIAQALGGRVEKFSGGWSVGRQVYDFDGEDIALNAWHQDQVVERPMRARQVGSSDFCENAALLYDGKAYSVQGHPEFGEKAVAALIEARAGVVPDDQLAAARKTLDDPVDNDKIAERFATFFKEAAAHA